MLALNLRKDEWLYIGEARITLRDDYPGTRNVRISIEAPANINIHREPKTEPITRRQKP